MDYPSPNFIRPQQFSSKCHEVQVDEASKLTVRLHYNPVMDEWLSLTEEVAPKQLEDSGEKSCFHIISHITYIESLSTYFQNCRLQGRQFSKFWREGSMFLFLMWILVILKIDIVIRITFFVCPDILFDLHKVEGPCTTEANEEIIKIGPFLDVSGYFSSFLLSINTYY